MEIHVEPPALQNQSPYGDSHGFEPAEPVLPSQGQEPTALLAPSALPEDIIAGCAREMSLDKHHLRWTKVDEQIQ